ncbi:MAG: DegT/DnrJ/EryC1/StrS family aminotransferase, partial [Bacteroidales bacterium]|nr:DegT/DnrJ/EryC1/StrS family aminotransferase [Bacteroidales bacterium]
IATILAITENDLIPVLVEPNINTYQLDDSLIESKITSKTNTNFNSMPFFFHNPSCCGNEGCLSNIYTFNLLYI